MPEKIHEQDILNFALNLEYLEAEFYTYATTGKSITSFGIGTKGQVSGSNPTTGGTTVGGKQVTFSDSESVLRDIATQIGADERAHVALLRGALRSSACAMPNIDLGALGFGFGNQNDFLRAARILEDIGVTAYSGAAGFLKTPDIITAAACLLGAEAEHAATIRTQIARLKIPTTALDGVDLIPPPSGQAKQVLSVKVSDGLIATRTAGQVLYLAADIKPLFRDIDISHMKRFDVELDNYVYMSNPDNADQVLANLSAHNGEPPSMPPGGPYWTADQLALFTKWQEDGYQP